MTASKEVSDILPSDIGSWSHHDVCSYFDTLESFGAERESVKEALLAHRIDGVYVLSQDRAGWQHDAVNLIGMEKAGVIFRVWHEMENLRKMGCNQTEASRTHAIADAPAPTPHQGGEAPDVMISLHCASSTQIAKNIDQYLKEQGFTTWMCLHMTAGMNYRTDIIKNASKCKAMVILLNKDWAESGECEFEANVTLRKNLVKGSPSIMPLVLQEFDYEEYPLVDAIMCNTNAIFMKGSDVTGLCRGLVSSLQAMNVKSKKNDNTILEEEFNTTNEMENQQRRALTWEFAAARGQISTLKALLKDGMDINIVTQYNDNALMLAARGGIETLKHMVRYAGGPNDAASRALIEHKGQEKVLMDACIKSTKFLISNGIDVEQLTKGGDSALSLAAYYEVTEVVAYMLEQIPTDSICKLIEHSIVESKPKSKKLLKAWKNQRK